MPRIQVNDGQEILYGDINNIAAAAEKEMFERVAYELGQRQTNFCFNDSFLVEYASSTSVTVRAGIGFQTDATQTDPESKKRLLFLDAAATATITAADGANPRIDIVSIKATRATVDTASRNYKAVDGTVSVQTLDTETDWDLDIVVTAGTPAGSPAVPSTPSGYIKIAELAIAATTGLPSTGGITDKRVTYMPYKRSLLSKTAAYTVLAHDEGVLADATSAAFTLTLPPAAQCTDKLFNFVKTDSSVNLVTLDGNASETINGATTFTLKKQYHSVILHCDGSVWRIMAEFGAPVLDQSYEVSNLVLTASVASSALTIAVKTKAGTDPTASDPIKVGMRNVTSTDGSYNQRTISSALSVVVSSGSTLGHASGVASYFYVYLIDNSGTLELGVSTSLLDDTAVQTSVAEGGAGAADAYNVLYSTTARTSKPIRLIGRMQSTQTTAGTWAAVPTEISLMSGKLPALSPTVQRFTSGSGTYTLPTARAPLYIRVRMCGAGGGGGGGGGVGNTSGSSGNATTFGSSLLTAGGGGGGVSSGGAGGAGGGATINSPAFGTGLSGGAGASCIGNANGGSGGWGGSNAFGGAGAGGGSSGVSAGAGVPNTGAGGGGSGAGSVTQTGGAGGGAGAYIDAIIPNPSATYAYSVGTNGSAGAAGSNAGAAGDGSLGYIEVTEYYQ